MIEKVLHPRNLTKAYRQVVSNKGSAGVDGMKTDQLKSFIDSNRSVIVNNVLTRRYLPQAIKKTLPYSFAERIRKLKEVYRGWLNNFRLGSVSAKLKKLDERLRNRIRYRIWHDWKKPERKRKNLIRLGVKQGMAYAWSRTRNEERIHEFHKKQTLMNNGWLGCSPKPLSWEPPLPCQD